MAWAPSKMDGLDAYNSSSESDATAFGLAFDFTVARSAIKDRYDNLRPTMSPEWQAVGDVWVAAIDAACTSMQAHRNTAANKKTAADAYKMAMFIALGQQDWDGATLAAQSLLSVCSQWSWQSMLIGIDCMDGNNAITGLTGVCDYYGP